MRYCIVSLLFNDYDLLREPKEIDNNCDYYFFTDNPNLKSKIWKVIYLREFNTKFLSGVQKSFIFKYTFYKYIPNINEYDYIIQLDANIQIYKSLLPIIEFMRTYKYDLSVAPHPFINNFSDEYDIWIKYRELDPKYKDIFFDFIGEFNLNGLIETTFKIYKVCPNVFNFIDDVHNTMSFACNNKDKLEQCYFTYVLYNHINNLRINYHSPNLYSMSEYMKVFEHNSDKYTWYNTKLYYEMYQVFLNKIVRITSDIEY